ncbi:hypothetical protein AYO21_04588 [Fonsecaea monophora]|uniref:Protein kinase domain-containing protein n=1 Tax=Fonsecaea monophora TaxID=254056 RepID=A0A177FAT0_9EURO|nr:hypothetical protein AYO21_04588 [Fonsecaea monophora]OAG41208.1 hypothetical protein AYO21_04588 [Fonsecaea monophora]
MSLISAADFDLRTLQTVLNYEELVKTFVGKRATFEAALHQGYPQVVLMQMLPWPGCLMHARAFAHRLNNKHKDIKPSNILVKDSHIYLADSGIPKDDVPDDLEGNASFSVWGYRFTALPKFGQTIPRLAAPNLTCSHWGRSLQDFQESRKVTTEDGETIAFRANWPQVHDWLGDLRGQGVHPVVDILIYNTASMLCDDPEWRDSTLVIATLDTEGAHDV